MKKTRLILLITSLLVTILSQPVLASATEYKSIKTGSNKSEKVGGKTFWCKRVKSMKNGVLYTLYTKKKGKKKNLIKGARFVTNGKTIYYSKLTKWASNHSLLESKYSLYKYSVKTGKSKKLFAKKGIEVLGASGKYIYYGKMQEMEGDNLYSYNIKTKRHKLIQKSVGSMIYTAGKSVFAKDGWQEGVKNVYRFNTDGSAKKVVVRGVTDFRISNNKIEYVRFNETLRKYRKYLCDLDGKNEQVLTPWQSNYPLLA